MSETAILETRETKRSHGFIRGAVALPLLGQPFLGRRRITVTAGRVTVVQGFRTRTHDDIEVFRLDG
jgi:hypothetical protein